MVATHVLVTPVGEVRSHGDLPVDVRLSVLLGRLAVAGVATLQQEAGGTHGALVGAPGDGGLNGAAMSNSTRLRPFTTEGSGMECPRTEGGPTC
jgi:hypothetical protein